MDFEDLPQDRHPRVYEFMDKWRELSEQHGRTPRDLFRDKFRWFQESDAAQGRAPHKVRAAFIEAFLAVCDEEDDV